MWQHQFGNGFASGWFMVNHGILLAIKTQITFGATLECRNSTELNPLKSQRYGVMGLTMNLEHINI